MNDPIILDQQTMLDMLDDRARGILTLIPGTITAVDATKGNCDVDVSVYADGHQFPPLRDLRIMFQQTAQYSITLPVKPGDHCVVAFSMLQLKHWRANAGKPRAVTDETVHPVTGAFVIPGLFPDSKTATIDPDNLVIQREGGPKITIKASSIDVSGDMNIDGDLDVSGDISASGTISADLEITAMAASPLTKVTVSQHKHATLGAPPTPGF